MNKLTEKRAAAHHPQTNIITSLDATEEEIPKTKLSPEKRFISYQKDESSWVRNQATFRKSTDGISHNSKISLDHMSYIAGWQTEAPKQESLLEVNGMLTKTTYAKMPLHSF